jgi:hypothetical protein
MSNNPLKYLDSTNPPPSLPTELVKVTQELNQQVFHVHLVHPDNRPANVNYVAIGGFLPRIGEVLQAPETKKYYKVIRVLHVLDDVKFGSQAAYGTKAHVLCEPSEAVPK